MPLAKRWIRIVFAALFLAGSVFAQAPQGAGKDKVPTFPEYKGQTVGEAAAYWTRYLGHPIHIADSPGGKPGPVTDPAQNQRMIVENHPGSPPNTEIDPNEVIGVVIVPASPWASCLQDCWWILAIALALGLLGGVGLGRRLSRA
jgi:hypothetical protein